MPSSDAPIQTRLEIFGAPAKVIIELTLQYDRRVLVDITDKISIRGGGGPHPSMDIVFQGPIEKAVSDAIDEAEFRGLV